MDCRAKELAEEADREREAQETAVRTTKEKTKAADTAEKKAATAKKNKALVEKKIAKLLAKQNETNVKLAEAISLNTAQTEELVDLKATLEACEEKWYNERFADAENSVEPVVNQARRLVFEARWLAALQTLGVPEDSPLRDPGQIPFSSSTAAAQDPPKPTEEEETVSMMELVEQIDAHAEPEETEATSIPSARDQPRGDLHSFATEQQQTEAADQTRPSFPLS